ncbi:substrate-binding domain-containing protein [Arthrobacter sp. D1-17]
MVTGPSFTSSGIARLAGARAAIDEAGIETPEPWLLAAGYGIEDSFTAGSALLAGYTKKTPTAVFAANGNIAMGIMAAAHRHNLRTGADLALVGYNNTALSSRLPTRLTPSHVHLGESSRSPIDLIIDPHNEPRVGKPIPTPIPRASSGTPNGNALNQLQGSVQMGVDGKDFWNGTHTADRAERW